jgi:predicted esterase
MKLAILLFGATALFGQSKLDAAFQKYWAADSPATAAKAAEEIAKSGASFDEIVQRLRAGRIYSAQKSGVVILQNKTSNGTEHYYAVNVPDGYDPKRKYQMRFQLHGGVGGREDNKPRGNGEIGALAGAEQFYVLPYAWNDSPWWDDDQVLNLSTIIDSMKRTYNIDENRVVLAGVSDGATGAYYISMRETTPYASFLPLNGFLMVLSNGEIEDGRIFANNLRNKPFYVINGGKDRLYPTAIVEPITKHLMATGVEIEYHPQPEGEHNTRWWPEMKASFEKFVTDHPRAPHPAKLSWQAADFIHNRAHWLVIDQYGKAAGEAQNLADLNVVNMSEGQIYNYAGGGLFGRMKESGRVDLVRSGNTVEASTKGVTGFTLLISPDAFDLAQPVKVVANGKEVFNARVQRDPRTLLKWAAIDNDRTMLYAAEVKIKLK